MTVRQFVTSVLIAMVIYQFVKRFVLEQAVLPELKDEYYGCNKSADDRNVYPFRVSVAESVLEDLKDKLKRTRFTDGFEATPLRYGVNVTYLRHMHDYWQHKYDWRKAERRINSFPQFRTQIKGLHIHFIHATPPDGQYNVVVPLLLLHGWPGSVYEFYKILPLLIDPARHKISSHKRVAFEVIAPSIPGYAWSDAPSQPGFGPIAAARVFGQLMARMNFSTYVCQGGDWGSVIATVMAQMFPDRVLGIHLNTAVVSVFSYPSLIVKYMLAYIMPSVFLRSNDYFKVYPMGKYFTAVLRETGYMHLQGTKPDTIGVALNDSPMGLAAYLLEKFSTWSSPGCGTLSEMKLYEPFSEEDLITNVMIYWTTGCISSSMRFYKEFFVHPLLADFSRYPVSVPTAVAAFPNDPLIMPEYFLTSKYQNLQSYTHMPRGGHFAALEEPRLLATDVYNFVVRLRKS